MILEDLIIKCIQKDPLAEKEFYYTYAKQIFGICRRYTSDDQIAEDYMQETMSKIFANLTKYDKSKGAMRTWISTITVNTVLSDKKKKRITLAYKDFTNIEQYGTSEVDKNELADIIAYEITKDELLRAIRQLPSDYRNVVNLYIFENWSHADIASIMNIEESSSRSKLTRAKKLLKNKLTKKSPSCYEGEVA